VVQSDTRLSFYKAFGWTPSEQIAIEQYYRELKLDWRFAQPSTLAGVPECLLLSLTPPPSPS